MTIQQRIPTGKYLLTVHDCLVLGEAGVFADRPTELRQGEIFIMSPEWRPHMRAKDEIAYRLRRALEERDLGLFVGTGGSVEVSEHDMPCPDVLLTSEPEGDGPVPARTVALVVEVSSTTRDYDLGPKAQVYAGAGIAEYWVIDLTARVIHQHWRPLGELYAERRIVALGEPLAAATMPELVVDTARL